MMEKTDILSGILDLSLKKGVCEWKKNARRG